MPKKADLAAIVRKVEGGTQTCPRKWIISYARFFSGIDPFSATQPPLASQHEYEPGDKAAEEIRLVYKTISILLGYLRSRV